MQCTWKAFQVGSSAGPSRGKHRDDPTKNEVTHWIRPEELLVVVGLGSGRTLNSVDEIEVEEMPTTHSSSIWFVMHQISSRT